MNYGSTLRFKLMDNNDKVYAEIPFTIKKDFSFTALSDAYNKLWEASHSAFTSIINDIEVSELFSDISDEDIVTEYHRRGLEENSPFDYTPTRPCGCA